MGMFIGFVWIGGLIAVTLIVPHGTLLALPMWMKFVAAVITVAVIVSPLLRGRE